MIEKGITNSIVMPFPLTYCPRMILTRATTSLMFSCPSPLMSAPVGVKKYSSVNELLNVGFDSYYGSFSDFKNIKTKSDWHEKKKNVYWPYAQADVVADDFFHFHPKDETV